MFWTLTPLLICILFADTFSSQELLLTALFCYKDALYIDTVQSTMFWFWQVHVCSAMVWFWHVYAQGLLSKKSFSK